MRDDVLEENEIPWHRGITFEVTSKAPTIDDAVEAARGEADATGILMAAAARTPVGPARPVLAVDVTRCGDLDEPNTRWHIRRAVEKGRRGRWARSRPISSPPSWRRCPHARTEARIDPYFPA